MQGLQIAPSQVTIDYIDSFGSHIRNATQKKLEDKSNRLAKIIINTRKLHTKIISYDDETLEIVKKKMTLRVASAYHTVILQVIQMVKFSGGTEDKALWRGEGKLE